MIDYAHNVRRLMARNGMTLRQLIDATGLHERTVKAILAGANKPHARTLHRLAAGLGASTDELFRYSSELSPRERFDRRTNPLVQELVEEHPEWFNDWTPADFSELFSHFGTGGALSAEGAQRLVLDMNRKRATHRKVALLLESGEAELVVGLVDLLYQKIAVLEA